MNEFHRISDEQRNEIIKRLDRILDLFEAIADAQAFEPKPPPPPTPISKAPSRRSRGRKSENQDS